MFGYFRPCEGSPISSGVSAGVPVGVAANGTAAEPLVSERAADSPLYGSPDALKRVQFHIGNFYSMTFSWQVVFLLLIRFFSVGGIAETAEEGPQAEVQPAPTEKPKETAADKKKRKQRSERAILWNCLHLFNVLSLRGHYFLITR